METAILVFCKNSKVFYTNVAIEESPNLILDIMHQFPFFEWFPFFVETTCWKFDHL